MKATRTLELDEASCQIIDRIEAGPKATRVEWAFHTRATPTVQPDGSLVLELDARQLQVSNSISAPWVVTALEKPPNQWDSPNPSLSRCHFTVDLAPKGTRDWSVRYTPNGR